MIKDILLSGLSVVPDSLRLYNCDNFFRFVMSSLNISGRRIIDMETVEEMIKAVDDGDGELQFDEFVQLLKK